MRNLLNTFLKRYRLKLVRLKEDFEPLHANSANQHPACLNYLSNQQPVVLEGLLEKGRALPLFTFSKDSIHPFVVAIRQAVKASDPREMIRATLEHYYKSHQPASAAALVGLDQNHALHQEPYWAIVLPWESDSVAQKKIRIRRSVSWENKVNGSRLNIADGWAWAGPVSADKLEVETERLFKTFTSISKYGYQRRAAEDGDIQAVALIQDNGDWVWQAQVGLHRAAVVAGLAVKSVPLRFIRNIYRCEVQHWPNVVSGLYSTTEALQVFDMIFEGDCPAAAASWMAAENKEKTIALGAAEETAREKVKGS